MQRIILLLFGVVGVFSWLAFRLRKTRPEFATVLFTLAVTLGALLLGGLFGVIGG